VPRLLDPTISARTARSLPHRPAFPDALTWLEIHAERPDAVAEWKRLRHHRAAAASDVAHPPHQEAHEPGAPRRRRRRRRRRGRGRRGPEAGPAPA
jgi:hypothetical protein